MKHVLLSTLALLLTCALFGQKEGTIEYIRVVKFTFEAPEGMEEMFKNMPKERATEKQLIFSGKQSMYQNPEDKIGSDDNVVEMGSDDFQIKMDFKEPEEKLFIDLDAKVSVHQQELFGKQFLVNGEPNKMAWKVGKGKKKIADYICMEATTMIEDTILVTAWFTPQIPISIGPGGYGGLPGLILQIDRANGEQTITATNIDLTTAATEQIIAPNKGKKVTQEQYKKIVDEKMEEMNAQRSGGGNTIIKIRH